MSTVSIAKGKGYARHNDRSLDPKDPEKKSWDSKLSSQNIIYKNESVRDAYDRIFGRALEKYNQSQVQKGRADRQIKNYYEKISRSKQEKTCYELIVQIGSMNDKLDPGKYAAAQKALDQYNQSFQKRNPNFQVFQQITHRDEKGMDHTHIMFVPVSTGNKRGLETKNSFSGALKEMGYSRNGFDQWREHELEVIKEVMKEHDLEFELGDGRTEHLNVRQYREYKKYESLTLEKQNTLSELQKSISEVENDLSELEVSKNDLEAEIDTLERNKEILQKNPTREVTENEHIKGLVRDFVDTYNDQVVASKSEFANKYSETHDDKAIAEYLTDDQVTIKKSILGEPTVTMPYSFWNQIKNNHNKLVESFKELRKSFFRGVEKLLDLFKIVRHEPEYLNAAKYSKQIKDLQNKTEKLESTIKSLETDNKTKSNQIQWLQSKNQEDEIALEVLDIFGSKMRNSMFIDNKTGEEVNMLDSIIEETELSFEAINIINARIDNYEELTYNRHEHDWDYEFDR